MSIGRALLVDLKNPEPWAIMPYDCKTTMFQQGFKSILDIAPEETIEDVVVVQGPENDICVYRSEYLLYKIEKPNKKFFEDLKNCQLSLEPVEYEREVFDDPEYCNSKTEDCCEFDLQCLSPSNEIAHCKRFGGDGYKDSIELIFDFESCLYFKCNECEKVYQEAKK